MTKTNEINTLLFYLGNRLIATIDLFNLYNNRINAKIVSYCQTSKEDILKKFNQIYLSNVKNDLTLKRYEIS